MAKVCKLTGSGIFVPQMPENQPIQVGSNAEHRINADFSHPICAEILKEMDGKLERNDIDELIQDVSKWPITCNSETFAYIYVVQKIIQDKLWQSIEKDNQLRLDFYRANPDVNLSQLIQSDALACVELSLLAGKMLENVGYDVGFISGAYICSPPSSPDEYMTASAHAFLVINDPVSDEVLIFDPANPLKFKGGGQAPSVSTTNMQTFSNWLNSARHGIAFMKLPENLSGATRCYGACDHSLRFKQGKYLIPNVGPSPSERESVIA